MKPLAYTNVKAPIPAGIATRHAASTTRPERFIDAG